MSTKSRLLTPLITLGLASGSDQQDPSHLLQTGQHNHVLLQFGFQLADLAVRLGMRRVVGKDSR